MRLVLCRLIIFLSALLITACISDGHDDTETMIIPPDQLGNFAVGHSTFTAVDEDRGDRPIPVDVWYPVDADEQQDEPRTSYPLAAGIGLDSDVAVDDLPVSKRPEQTLLLFSHGYGGINTQSTVLMEALASHGFIVVSLEHTGNSQVSNTDDFDTAASNRVPDVSFLIDTMLKRSADPDDAFYNRIDTERVGVLGHSFGGMTAIGAAAGWAGAMQDPRVAAIAPISAVIDGELQSDTRTGPNAGFSAASLAMITEPVLLLGGTQDVNVPVENNAIAFEQMVSAQRVYQVDIIGANHNHFANVCGIGDLLIELGISQDLWPDIGAEDLLEPYALTCTDEVFPIDEVIRLQNIYLVAFFKRHLLNEQGYDQYLSSDYANTEAAVNLRVR